MLQLVLVIASFGLTYWTGFRVVFEGYVIDGFYWVLIGILAGCVVTRKQDTL